MWVTERAARKEAEKKGRKKRIILAVCIIIPLGLIFMTGVVLFAIGEAIESTPMMIAGGIVAGIIFIPTLIFGIIYCIKNGIPIWW